MKHVAARFIPQLQSHLHVQTWWMKPMNLSYRRPHCQVKRNELPAFESCTFSTNCDFNVFLPSLSIVVVFCSFFQTIVVPPPLVARGRGLPLCQRTSRSTPLWVCSSCCLRYQVPRHSAKPGLVEELSWSDFPAQGVHILVRVVTDVNSLVMLSGKIDYGPCSCTQLCSKRAELFHLR